MVIIGPGTLPGPMAFVGTRWRGRVGSRAQIRRTCESPRHRAAPYCHHTRCGEINLTAESLADDRHGGMNSLLFPNRRIPGRHGKFRTRRSCALRNQINSKPRSHSSGRQRAGHGGRTTCDMNSKLRERAAGHGQPGLIRNDAQSRLVRITAASCGNSRDDASRPMRWRSRLYAGDDHVRLDEGLKLVMSKPLRALK